MHYAVCYTHSNSQFAFKTQQSKLAPQYSLWPLQLVYGTILCTTKTEPSHVRRQRLESVTLAVAFL